MKNKDGRLRRGPESNDSSTISISDTSATVTASSNPDLNSETISISSLPKTPEHSIRSETSRSDTIHSAIDIDSTGIPILQEAIDTKPNQLLIFTWLRNEMQVRDKLRKKQRILEVTLPTNNPDLIKKKLFERIHYSQN